MLGKDVTLLGKEYDYGTEILKDPEVESVIVEDTVASSKISNPVESEKANIMIHFYSKDDAEDLQKNSLIYYENTYLPNTGVIFGADEEFEVKTAFAGKVTDITDDEFFGKCVVVEHSQNLRTYYYGLANISVQVGDELQNDAVLGTSQNNVILNEKKTFLMEVYYNNELLNPEKFIGTRITDYK